MARGLPVDAVGGARPGQRASPNGREFTSWHLTSTRQTAGNPTQTWNASHIADADGSCGGFAESVFKTVKSADPAVPANPAVPMGYWTEADLPFYHGLAKTFPVADRWFCSCLGPTFPNRRFLIAGTAHGLIDDLPWDLVDYPRGRDHLRRADQARHHVGELPQRAPSFSRAQTAARRFRPCRPAAARLRRPVAARSDERGPRQQVVHRRPVSARVHRQHQAPAVDAAVFRRCPPGEAAAGVRRRPGLRSLLGGEPAGRHPRRSVLRLGDQGGHEGARLGVNAADLDLRRARRLLRPRGAAARRRAGRRARAQLAAVAPVVPHAAPPGRAQAAHRAGERRRRAGDV